MSTDCGLSPVDIIAGCEERLKIEIYQPYNLRKRSSWSHYTLTSAKHRKATVKIAVHCRNWRRRRGRHGCQTLVYAFWGIQPKTTSWIFEVYRQRFGIETSYRQLGEACIKTTTRNPTLHLLFIGITLFLRNVWVSDPLALSRNASPRPKSAQLLDKLRFKTC